MQNAVYSRIFFLFLRENNAKSPRVHYQFLFAVYSRKNVYSRSKPSALQTAQQLLQSSTLHLMALQIKCCDRSRKLIVFQSFSSHVGTTLRNAFIRQRMSMLHKMHYEFFPD